MWGRNPRTGRDWVEVLEKRVPHFKGPGNVCAKKVDGGVYRKLFQSSNY